MAPKPAPPPSSFGRFQSTRKEKPVPPGPTAVIQSDPVTGNPLSPVAEPEAEPEVVEQIIVKPPTGPPVLILGSVKWEQELFDRFSVLVAQEKVKKQALLNVMLRHFLDGPERDRAKMIGQAREWQRNRQ